jgi:hypothetical protein
MPEMREITIIRKDTLPGFEDDHVKVHVNFTSRKLRNGQSLLLLGELPADVQIFCRDTQIWEGQVGAESDESATVYAGINRAIAEREGWIATAQTPTAPLPTAATKAPKLSARAIRIQEVMEQKARWMESNKAGGYYCFVFSVIPLILAICALVQHSGFWVLVCALICLALIGCGFYLLSLQPSQCAKCNAPTLTRTSYKENLAGVRSEQRRIRNQVTNEDEQRTVTVSDINVVEKWLCVTCDHEWTYRHSYVSG